MSPIRSTKVQIASVDDFSLRLTSNTTQIKSAGSSKYSSKNKNNSSSHSSEFSDVYPTDWTYKALQKMAEQNECKSIKTTGPMTRFEAAELLNSCLTNISSINDEERSLIEEFSSELSIIKGKIET